MNPKSLLIALVLVSGTVAVSGCVVGTNDRHGRYEQSRRETVPDARIEDAIRSELRADRNIDSRDITVVVRNGNVKLSGVVGSRSQLERALQVASSVNGVRHVTNRIQLR